MREGFSEDAPPIRLWDVFRFAAKKVEKSAAGRKTRKKQWSQKRSFLCFLLSGLNGLGYPPLAVSAKDGLVWLIHIKADTKAFFEAELQNAVMAFRANTRDHSTTSHKEITILYVYYITNNTICQCFSLLYIDKSAFLLYNKNVIQDFLASVHSFIPLF